MKCPLCERESDTVERRQLNTLYVEEELNYQTSCLECYEDTIEYYKECWQEYHQSR